MCVYIYMHLFLILFIFLIKWRTLIVRFIKYTNGKILYRYIRMYIYVNSWAYLSPCINYMQRDIIRFVFSFWWAFSILAFKSSNLMVKNEYTMIHMYHTRQYRYIEWYPSGVNFLTMRVQGWYSKNILKKFCEFMIWW